MCLHIIRAFPIRRLSEAPHARILSCPSNRLGWEWTIEHKEDWQAFVAQLPPPDKGWKALRYNIRILDSQVPPWRALVIQTDSPGSVFKIKWWWPQEAVADMKQLLVDNEQLQLEFTPYKWYWSYLPKVVLTLGPIDDRSPLPGQPIYSHETDQLVGKDCKVKEGQVLTRSSVEHLETSSVWHMMERPDNHFDSMRSTLAIRGSLDDDATLAGEDLPPAQTVPENPVAQS
ncbi:hypothetical protein PMIN06_007194 [Paraphaeosphaeria minitans]